MGAPPYPYDDARQIEEQRKFAKVMQAQGMIGSSKDYNLPESTEPSHFSLIQEHIEGCFRNTEHLFSALSRLDEGHGNIPTTKDDGPSNPGLLPLLVYQMRELRLRLDRLVAMTARY